MTMFTKNKYHIKLLILNLFTILFSFGCGNFNYQNNENTNINDIIIVNDETKSINAGKYQYYLEDTNGRLAIEDVLGKNIKYKKNNKKILNFRYSSSIFWLKSKIKSQAKENKVWLMQISNPLIDYVDFYIIDENKIVKEIKTGYSRHFSSREYKNRNFIFELLLNENETRDIYVRIFTRSRVEIPIKI